MAKHDRFPEKQETEGRIGHLQIQPNVDFIFVMPFDVYHVRLPKTWLLVIVFSIITPNLARQNEPLFNYPLRALP